MVCGLVPSLSSIVILPGLTPTVLGVKTILSVQLAPGKRLVGQLLLWAKSPLATMSPRTNGVLPVFFSRIFLGVLGVPVA